MAAKRVTQQPDLETRYRYLVWRFGRLDHKGEFGCQKLLSTDAPELEAEIAVFQEDPIPILRRKHWLKFIGVEDMTADGRRALSQINKQEHGLWQLHLQRNKWRVWGYFEDPEFFFLWWDSDHDVATGQSRRRKAT